MQAMGAYGNILNNRGDEWYRPHIATAARLLDRSRPARLSNPRSRRCSRRSADPYPVAGTLQRRLWVLLGSATAALAGWWWLPGTAIDRLAFTTVARSFANPPLFISGNGSHDAPWNLRTLAVENPTDTRQAPVIVALGDDREGFFQSSPPSPIDLAVILTNFQRLGARQAATAVVMAWDSPDPIGLAALDKAIHRFDSLVMAVPLSRGAVSEAMPPAFRKASVPLASVSGDSWSLPIVNRIPLPGVILGQENTAAGFQTLDAETDGKSAPLLACWEDRVVFSFALLCVLQRLDLPVAGMEIHPGEWLKLGPHGPILPIDRYGRLAMPRKPVAPYAEIPAESLIDGGDGLIPREAPPPVVLRDDRSAAEPATRAFSKQLPALIAALASSNSMAPAHDYPRPQAGRELWPAACRPGSRRSVCFARLPAPPCFSQHGRVGDRRPMPRGRHRESLVARSARTGCHWLCCWVFRTDSSPPSHSTAAAPVLHRPPRRIPKPPPLTAAIAAPGPNPAGKPMVRRITTPKTAPPEPASITAPEPEPKPAPEPNLNPSPNRCPNLRPNPRQLPSSSRNPSGKPRQQPRWTHPKSHPRPHPTSNRKPNRKPRQQPPCRPNPRHPPPQSPRANPPARQRQAPLQHPSQHRKQHP